MIKDSIERLQMDGEEFVTAFAWKFSKLNILSLLEFLGEKRFLEFLDQFGGNYIRVPTASKINDFFERQKLLHIHRLMTEAYKRGDSRAWETFEHQFIYECKNRLHIRYETGLQLVKQLEAENKESLSWYRNLKAMESRQERKEL